MSKQLDEINLLRPIVIILLIIVHSFTMYAGGWNKPEGIHDVRAYFWISKLSFSCMLEAFVFISGYLFAFQIHVLRKKCTFWGLLTSKFKRLIIPSIIFSILYSLFFYTKQFHIIQYLYDIVNGLGHMWFLPMLFWCFMFSYILMHIEIREGFKLLLLVSLAICSFLPLPFRVSSACYYLLFFYLGFYLLSYKELLLKCINGKRIILGIIVFIVLFIPLTLLREYIFNLETSNILYKVLKFVISTLSKVLYATAGLVVFYFWSIYYTRIIKTTLPSWLMNFNALCFGIYLYQQFILKYLYYKTSLPVILGSYWLPIFGCVITLVFSVILSKLSLRTKVGKYLLG